MAFSPTAGGSSRASDERTVKVWDAATGQETLTLKGHTVSSGYERGLQPGRPADRLGQ